MSPRREPTSLYKLCVRMSVIVINTACDIIEGKCPIKVENVFGHDNKEYQTLQLKTFLMSILPVRLFDVLCSQRTCYIYRGDPCVQLTVLTHPHMTVFRKSDNDNGIHQNFWIHSLPYLNHLVILDLKFISTDEILHVIGLNCLLLQELNIVSRVDIRKSLFNASVLIRNVSDSGLLSLKSLKHLRVLAMDPPRNERANRVGRCVSQAGIIALVSELPSLEELLIESCDIGSTLIGTSLDVGPLSLRKINSHSASAEGIGKLTKICPYLEELSVTHLSEHDKDAILEQISISDLKLNRLDLSFFSYTQSMHLLLMVKGAYLTHFSLWDQDHSLTLDAVMSLGRCCPNLNSLCLMTQSRRFVMPLYLTIDEKMFSKLRRLTIGNENFNLDKIVTFFLNCTYSLEKLVLKFQTKINFDGTLLNMLAKDSFRNVQCLWLDCTLEVSKDVVKQVIDKCEKLQHLTVDLNDITDIHRYIKENNFDLKLGSY